MHFLITALGFILASSPALADTTNGPCVKACFSQHAISSQCNGDETGAALDQCTCASFVTSVAAPLLSCVKACPADQQSIFAGNLPSSCRGQVLPGVTPAASGTTPSPTAGGQSSSTTSTGSQTSQTTKPNNAATDLGSPGLAIVGGLIMAALF